jgi:hypothetical protein
MANLSGRGEFFSIDELRTEAALYKRLYNEAGPRIRALEAQIERLEKYEALADALRAVVKEEA